MELLHLFGLKRVAWRFHEWTLPSEVRGDQTMLAVDAGEYFDRKIERLVPISMLDKSCRESARGLKKVANQWQDLCDWDWRWEKLVQAHPELREELVRLRNDSVAGKRVKVN